MTFNAKKTLMIAVAAAVLASGAPAQAQQDLLGDPDPDALSQPPAPAGPLTSVGEALRQIGIDMRLDFVNLYSNAPNFGYKTGQSGNYGFLIFDTTLNLSEHFKIRWQETVNTPVYNVEDYYFQLANGFFATLPVLDTATDLTRLTALGVFLDGNLEIEAGRMNMWPDFFRTEYCAGIGCIAQIRALVLNAPGNTLAEWGGRVSYNLSPTTVIGAVVTENNPDNWQTGNGWDWGEGNSDGYTAVAHIAQRENFMQNPLPLSYEIGAYRSSTPYYDALYNPGWGNPTFGPDPIVVQHDGGTNGIFAQLRKVVWSEPNGTPFPENIALYGGAFYTFGDGQAYPLEAYAGIEYGGFWAQNPMTSIGATIHYLGLSQERADYETNARLFFSGDYDPQPRDTYQIDVHARFGVSKFGILEVGAAYMINPNTTLLADYSSSRMKDGFVIYAGLYMDLGTLLGLSKPLMR
ncbi:carbohydrate porin [Ancylobacter sp. IITR112]|uniref:carbohydrate porin n=1 Tax=Ancylobacter sp. IITR112 TaxID=3138073 RepID=UPI00352B643F